MGVAQPARNRITRAGTPAGGSDENIYVGWYFRFLLVFGLLAVATVIGVSLDSSVPAGETAVVVGLVLALALWYWFYGQWHLIRSDAQAVVYLLGNIVAVTICIRIWEPASLLLFGLYWLGFAYLYTQFALVYALLLTIATQWAFGTIGSNIGFNMDTLIALGILIVLLGFSAMMARYIEAFQVEAERNRALVEELQRTQRALAEREREAGMAEERRRMAGEIHDTIAQHFASIITNLRAAAERGGNDPDISSQHVAHALSSAQQGLQDSRNMLSTMQPDIMQGRSVTEVLTSIVEEWSRHSRANARIDNEGVPARLSKQQESALVRGLQEALRNIDKHAGATDVTVTLSWLENEVLLDITDNGTGFVSADVQPGAGGYRMGLTTMAARVEGLGGTFALETAPGEGTSIAISFPAGGEE